MTKKRQIGLILLSWIICVPGICQSPIAYYNFDNNANDFSGNRNDGVMHGNIKSSVDRFGNPCGALQFDGISSYIEVPSSPSLESPVNAFTITVWYRIENFKDNTWLTVLCKGATRNELPENPQYRLQAQQNTANVMNSCTPGIIGGSSTISINTAFTKCDPTFQNHLFETDKWSFYASVFNGRTVTFYMNDLKVFEYNYTEPLIKNNSSLFIGMDEPGNTEYFEGHLDDLYIFNRALSEKEITNLYTEIRQTNFGKDEFDMPMMNNMVFSLPPNNCKTKVTFNPPQVNQSSCGTITVRQIYGPPSGSIFPVGKHLITYEAVSTTGYEQQSSFYIIVNDLTPPSIFIPRDTTVFVKNGVKGTVFQYGKPSATDNCAVKSLDIVEGISTKSFFPLGKSTIRYRAMDINGNSSEKSFSVEIKEEPIPQLEVVTVSPPKPDPVPPPKPEPVPPDKVETGPSPKLDSFIIKKKDTIKTYLPEDLLIREKIEMKLIEVNSYILKGVLYDNGVYDGDTVSLFLNNRVILPHQEVTIGGTNFTIEIDSTMDNELLMYAENLGKIPPNTALLYLDDGNTRFKINLLSTLKTNGVITIRKKKKKF